MCSHTSQRQGSKEDRLNLLKFQNLFKGDIQSAVNINNCLRLGSQQFCGKKATVLIKRRISHRRWKLSFTSAHYTDEPAVKILWPLLLSILGEEC